MIKRLFQLLLICSLFAPATSAAEGACLQGKAAKLAEKGVHLISFENYTEAAGLFKRAIALDPSCFNYRVMLAAAYERAGDRTRAARELENSLYSTDIDLPIKSRERNEVKRVIRLLKNGLKEKAATDDSTSKRSKPVCAGGGNSYQPENVLFTFMQITDLHIGQRMDGGADSELRLRWITDTAYPSLKPSFIITTGDLTDSTGGFIIPAFGPYKKEWTTYAQAVSLLPQNSYYDVPGNHDHYGDKEFEYFLTYSVSKALQQSWTVEAGGRKYQFITVNTAANDGKPWPFDNTGLDDSELSWLESAINPSAERISIFGHHPLRNFTYGNERFRGILKRHKASYFHGHIHRYEFKAEDGRLTVSIGSLGKSRENNYLLGNILKNGDICVQALDAGSTQSERK